ncbi:MAG: glycosyltransferase family 2 protein [Firmicutes bacterium]|nr:glycosyltransferase family 2 protein [Bacillota bacterium]
MELQELKTAEQTAEIKTVDVIVPCFNEAQNIDAFYDAVQQVAESISGYDFSYIFIDDGSEDDTLEMIREIAAAAVTDVTTVRYISFSRNFGKEAAMYAGLKASSESRGGRGADYAVLIDADLQHPPELIREMIKTIEETGCDSCAARRVSRKGEPRIRSLFARGFYRIMNRFSDIEIIDGAVDFRMMDRRMVKAIVSLPETQRFSKGIFSWVGFDTRWIEFENVKRLSGESKWTMWGLLKYAIAGFLDFAEAPLKFTGLLGSLISVGAVIYLIVELLKTLIVGKDVPGYESLICLLLLFGGMILAVLSVIGEYIGRMYLETKGRPIYIEKESNIDDE